MEAACRYCWFYRLNRKELRSDGYKVFMYSETALGDQPGWDNLVLAAAVTQGGLMAAAKRPYIKTGPLDIHYLITNIKLL